MYKTLMEQFILQQRFLRMNNILRKDIIYNMNPRIFNLKEGLILSFAFFPAKFNRSIKGLYARGCLG